MKGDDSAVAGFFEDLPVLFMVLAGVATLVVAGAWVSQERSDARRLASLSLRATFVVDLLVQDIRDSASGEGVPLLSHINSLNFSEILRSAEVRDASISVSRTGPPREPIISFSTAAEAFPVETGYASCFIDAVDSTGLIVMLEVQAIVW